MEEKLIKRLNCSEKEACIIANDLGEISIQLKPLVEKWLEDESIDLSAEAEGYSMECLMKEYGMKFTGAILTLDWLIKSPQEAKNALAYGIR